MATADTARHAAKTAEASEEMNLRIGVLINAMNQQLQIARQSQADAERSERFTRMMAWSSLAVAIASLADAVVAVLISG